MIVPRNALLFWFAMATLPFALVGAIAPEAGLLCAAVAGGFALIAVIDAVRAPASLAGIEIEVAPVVRMSKDREGKIELRIRNEVSRERLLRIALDLPSELSVKGEVVDALLPKDSQWSRLEWKCVPTKRGNYRLTAVFVEGTSRLGFWAARREMTLQSEIRVYPNLARERRNLSALFLNRGAFGVHAQRQVGKGRDFEKLREYVPGDGFDEIHWKATARRAKPITKVFQIERTQEVYVVIDASRLSAKDAGSGSVLETLVTAALVLGLAAEKQGDLFGMLVFREKVESFVRARNGKAHYSRCRDTLYTLESSNVNPDFDEVCAFIRARLRRRALIVFLTSLDDPVIAEGFVRNVELIRRQHLVMVNMIRHSPTAPLFTGSDPSSIDDLYVHLGGHLRWQRLRQLEKTLGRRGVHFSLLENERLSADLVSQYLNVKRRQLL